MNYLLTEESTWGIIILIFITSRYHDAMMSFLQAKTFLYCLILSSILLIFDSSCCTTGCGYFYISVDSDKCGSQMKQAIDMKANSIPLEYGTPDLHGPFETAFQARHKMHTQKTNDSCTVYYTRIFKM
jgi:hypothetical protein